jgi:hypothetical protein
MMHNNSNSYGISDNKNSNSISNSSDIKMWNYFFHVAEIAQSV